MVLHLEKNCDAVQIAARVKLRQWSARNSVKQGYFVTFRIVRLLWLCVRTAHTQTVRAVDVCRAWKCKIANCVRCFRSHEFSKFARKCKTDAFPAQNFAVPEIDVTNPKRYVQGLPVVIESCSTQSMPTSQGSVLSLPMHCSPNATPKKYGRRHCECRRQARARS